MNLDEIKQILDMMREHELSEFELEREGVTLRLKKNSPPQWSGPMPAMGHVPFPPAAPGGPLPAAPALASGAEARAGAGPDAGW